MTPVQNDELLQMLTENVPGREGDWAENMSAALDRCERAIRRHAAIVEAPNGTYAQIDLTRPTLARRVANLRQEHGAFLEQTRALKQEMDGIRQAFKPYEDLTAQPDPLPRPPAVAAIPDFGSLRQRVEQLWAALDHHTHEEANLVVETVTTDIGVGD
jgi:hypothetical protein